MYMDVSGVEGERERERERVGGILCCGASAIWYGAHVVGCVCVGGCVCGCGCGCVWVCELCSRQWFKYELGLRDE